LFRAALRLVLLIPTARTMLSLVTLLLLPTMALGQAVAAESWAFLYPLVLMNETLTTEFTEGKQEGYNLISHKRAFSNASDRNVVQPNVDTLYSGVWFDLPAGDDFLTINVPDTKGRYYVWQWMDMWTNTFLSLGPRTTGMTAQSFRLVGPDYTGPMDESTLTAPTRNGFTILRILCNGPEDYAFVNSLQDGFNVSYSGGTSQSLSATQPLPPDVVAAMGAQEFFEYASDVMAAGNMPKEEDALMVRGLATIGVVPGETFDWKSLPLSTRTSMNVGVSAAKKIMDKVVDSRVGGSGPGNPNWQHANTIGNYSDHYIIRAGIARIGLGANIKEDAFYTSAAHGSDRNPLKGDRNYTITFGPGQLPPVNGFWSVTAYDENKYLIQNPANIYALGDRSHLVSAADGSTTIHLSPSAPKDESLRANWLPTPTDAVFSLTMRLYWPTEAVLNGSWVPPQVVPEGDIAAVLV